MKKILTLTVCALMLLCMTVFQVSAASIDDVVAAVAENPLLSHLAGDVRNIARNYDFTPEQCDKLIELIKAFNEDVEIDYDELGNLDYGSMTPEEIIEAGTKLVNDAVNSVPELELGTQITTPGGKIENTTITIVDKEGDVVMVIDKNIIGSTAYVKAEADNASNGIYFTILAVSVAALASLLIVSNKRAVKQENEYER